MSTMTPLIEYLMALRRPGGGKLCRFGVQLFTIPILPPLMSVTVTVTPYFGSYMSIEYWHRFSPAIVPNTVEWTVRHGGMEIASGLVSQVATDESHNFWLEITESDPSVATITNVTPVNQFYETLDHFLLVDNEEDYLRVKEVIRNWGNDNVLAALRETNQLLRAISTGQPAPQPPIGGS